MTQQRVSPVSITSVLPATVTLSVQGALGQSANLQEWKSSTGSNLAFIRNDGYALFDAAGLGSTIFINSGAFVANTQLSSVSRAASLVSIVARGAASQTADIFQAQSSAGTVLSSIDSSGQLRAPNIGIGGSSVGIAYARFTSSDTTAVTMVIRAFPSQTGNLFQWQLSDGTVRGRIDQFGTLIIGTPTGGYGAWLNIQPVLATDKGIIVRGQTSQSANLQEWQISDGTVKSRVLSDGTLRGNIQTQTGHSQFSEFNGGGYIMFNEATASATSGNTSKVAIWVVTGTNANTLKLVARSNGAEVTLLDNIPKS